MINNFFITPASPLAERVRARKLLQQEINEAIVLPNFEGESLVALTTVQLAIRKGA